MIKINMPLKRDYVQELLDGKTFEDITYTYIKTEQMKMFFETSEDSERSASVAKATIKASELGSALYFMVEYVK